MPDLLSAKAVDHRDGLIVALDLSAIDLARRGR